ncbi:MAG: type II toxin-antitoxin system VapC family toxin [Ignavibacteriales bacterium]|nr:type II toxin-antitoxin system VapC family toxin [Ignavibacteriales bacterium]
MKYLIDSNIIIYSCIPDYKFISDFIIENLPAVSIISKIEVLGYSKITSNEKLRIENIFNILEVIGFSEEIVSKTIELKSKYNLKLADAIIAATSIVNELVLCTRNLKDFNKIKKIKLYNPFDD